MSFHVDLGEGSAAGVGLSPRTCKLAMYGERWEVY